MVVGSPVFCSDSAHIGRIDALDETIMTVRSHDDVYLIPRDDVAYESEEGDRVFLKTRNRSGVRQWRTDLRQLTGLRAWLERHVFGPSQRWVGGKMFD